MYDDDKDIIYPLFKPNDVDDAIEYFASGFDDSIISMQSSQPIPDKLRESILYNMIESLYGKNVVLMANYLLVDNIFLDKIDEPLRDYLNHVGADYSIIEMRPSVLTSHILAKKRRHPLGGPLEGWDPRRDWDLEDKDLDPEMALTNPINGFCHMTLILKNVNNKNFLTKLYRNNIIDSDIVFKNNFNVEQLEVKLLPYNNFNKLMNIMQAIFEYY